MRVRLRPVRAALVALLVAGTWAPEARAAFPFFDRSPYNRGDPVPISGRVTDGAGRPLEGVTVLLEVSRNAFRLRRLGRETSGALQVPTTTDADGRYRLDWRWDPYYNEFALLVALPLRVAGRDVYEIYLRQEITGHVRSGHPVEIPLVLADTTAYHALRDFLAGLTSDDARRVYREMGRPDRIDLGQASYDPDRTWWYFAAGKAYRFRDGRLDQVVPFEPVPDP